MTLIDTKRFIASVDQEVGGIFSDALRQ